MSAEDRKLPKGFSTSPDGSAAGVRPAGEFEQPSAPVSLYRDLCSVALALLGLAAGTLAADEPLPEPAFLEYLGSWEETDEDWLLFETAVHEPAASIDEEQSDSEESPESKDEH
jgi:hypothetical protein